MSYNEYNRERGRQKGRIEIAKAMLAEEMDIALIKKVMQLSQAEIEGPLPEMSSVKMRSGDHWVIRIAGDIVFRYEQRGERRVTQLTDDEFKDLPVISNYPSINELVEVFSRALSKIPIYKRRAIG